MHERGPEMGPRLHGALAYAHGKEIHEFTKHRPVRILMSDKSTGAPSPSTPIRERLIAVLQARNPLLEAARPLIRALAEMPEQLGKDEPLALRLLLEQEVRTFQKVCEQANIRRDHMIGARYCLCTALDEAAAQTAWSKEDSSGIEWIRHGLATTVHEDRHGGEKVYLLIARLLDEPEEHRDLLQVIYRILSLGFEGRYRHEPNGERHHYAIRERLYKEITAHRGPAPLPLSVNEQSDVIGRRRSFYEFPVWITVSVLSAALLATFGWFKYQLINQSAEVQKQIADIGRMMPPPAAPAPAVTSLRLKPLLKNEIAAGTVRVDEDAGRSAVIFRGDAMFPPGGVDVKASMGPLITKIAKEISKVHGKVTVLGYTDNIPIRSGRFASNQALSEERATQVMQMLQAAGVSANRLEAVGKGDAAPIGENRTAQGRAQNRRVEIIVAQ